MRIIAAGILISICTPSFAQDLLQHVISLESTGAGGWVSLYYDYAFHHYSGEKHPDKFLDAKIGVGTFSFNPMSWTIPHGFTWNAGSKKIYSELGLAGSFVFRRDGNERNYYLTGPVIGMRWVLPKDFHLRLQVSSVFSTENGFHKVGVVGLSLGLGKVIGKQ